LYPALRRSDSPIERRPGFCWSVKFYPALKDFWAAGKRMKVTQRRWKIAEAMIIQSG
jgi:hypothetical protein